MKPVLVFGGTGVIGRHLLRHLTTRGEKVILLARQLYSKDDYLSLPEITVLYVRPPLRTDMQLRDAICSVDTIYNLAGQSGPVLSNTEPISSLDNICGIQADFLSACVAAGTRPHIVFVSSRLVYGVPQRLPVTENSPLQPTCYYAAHKICTEHYLEIEAGRGTLSFSICRVSNPYGAEPALCSTRPSFIDQLISKACQGEPLNIYGSGEQLRDYIHIDELVHALVLCGHQATQGASQTYNIGRGQSIQIIQAATALARLTGVTILHVPFPAEDRVIETGDFRLDISKANKELGFYPTRLFRDDINELIKLHCQHLPKDLIFPKT